MRVRLISCYQLVHLYYLDEARIVVDKIFGVYMRVYELVTCGIANSEISR
jgi:hypothetical protein